MLFTQKNATQIPTQIYTIVVTESPRYCAQPQVEFKIFALSILHLFLVPDYPDELYYVEVPVISNTECTGDYGPGQINENMICAGNKQTTDSCQVRSIYYLHLFFLMKKRMFSFTFKYLSNINMKCLQLIKSVAGGNSSTR